MEFTKQQMTMTKGIAILLMLLLHLFCTKDYLGLFEPWIVINEVPLVYYFALFGDCCVAIYCFCSGYGLMVGYIDHEVGYQKRNIIRIAKLYLNFWIIFLIFVIGCSLLFGKADFYLSDVKMVLLAFLGLDTEFYNGAWWFLTIYILLCLVSPWLNRLVLKYSSWLVVVGSLVIYFVAYLQRFKSIIMFDIEVLDWAMSQLAYFGTSLFPFLVGSIFARHQLYSRMVQVVGNIRGKNIICMSIIVLMIIAHGVVQTLFVAPFIGIVFVCLFNLMNKPKWFNAGMTYIGRHSTNLWLIHMFFYLVYFRELVFLPKFPLLIFVWLVVLCLLASSLINRIYFPLNERLDRKLKEVLY